MIDSSGYHMKDVYGKKFDERASGVLGMQIRAPNHCICVHAVYHLLSMSLKGLVQQASRSQ
jgi:hypothetical protein